jgi:NADPH:quinone reductase-like Zn-dependent oxidoreductase
MKYRSILVSQHGGPEVLQIVEKELRPPAAGEARIRVLAASVSRPDVTVRRGESLYRARPLTKSYRLRQAMLSSVRWMRSAKALRK